MRQTLLIISLFILFGCGKSEIEKIISTYDNGQPEAVFYYKDKDDTLTYRKEWFYESGKPMYTGNVVNGLKEGVWTWWYEDGKIKDKCKYINEYYIDTIFHYSTNGKLSEMEIVPPRAVRQDSCRCCNGTIIRYYDNGMPKERITKVNDKVEGICTFYQEDGGWKMQTFKNDSLWGPTIEHNIDSTEIYIVIGQYINGKEDGLWKWFDKDSTVYQTAVYDNGVLNGQYVEYYKNGKIKSEGILKDGYYDGLVKYYEEDGKLSKAEKHQNSELIETKKY